MEGAKGNNSGRGRGRGRGAPQQGGGGRGGGGGGGRGFEGSYPARPQGNQPPPPQQQAWGNRPPVQGNQQAWGNRPPVQGNQQAWGNRPPPQPNQHAWGNRPPPQQAWGGRGGSPWGPSQPQPQPQPQSLPPSSSSPPPTASLERLSLQSPTTSGKQASPPSTASKEAQSQAIRRPDHGTLAVRKINLVVNHFPIKFDTEGTIYHYDVDVKPVDINGNRLAKKVLRKSDLRFIKDLAFPGAELLRTVYDGEKNVFSAIRLGEGQYKVDVPDGEDVRSGSYMFTIKLVNELKLSKLKDYLKGNITQVPRDALQGLDLVMKENPMRARIALNNRSFFSARNSADLRGGLAAYKGFIPSLKPTGQGLSLCLDYSVLAFRKPLPVIEFLKQHVGLREVNDVVRMAKVVNDALQGLKVKVNHRRTNQKYTIAGLTREITRNISFELIDSEGGEPPRWINLVDYFREKWGKVIRHLDIPCLDVGNPKKPNVIPLEFCVLAEGQKFPKEYLDKDTGIYLKKLTLVKPWERRDTICDMVRAEDGSFGYVFLSSSLRALLTF